MQYLGLALAIFMASACRFDFDYAVGNTDAAASNGASPDAEAPPSSPAGPDAAPGSFCDPANPDLIGCYTFEGTTADGSGSGHDLDASASYVPGQVGLALGAGSNAAAPESQGMSVTAYTVELWVRPDSTPAPGGQRMGLFDNDDEYGMFLYENNQIRCSGNGRLYITYALPIDAWTHVACTHDGATLTAWVDGVPIDSGPADAIAQDGVSGWSVGMDSPGGDNFDGDVDQVRIWRIIRSPDEICAAAAPACAP